MIELKQYLSDREFFNTSFHKSKETGYIYEYKYVLPTHAKIREYKKGLTYNERNIKAWSVIENKIVKQKDPLYIELVSHFINVYYNTPHTELTKEIIDSLNKEQKDEITKCLFDGERKKYTKKMRPMFNKYAVKKRFVLKTKKYNTLDRSENSIIFLKSWSKITKKTSNKGLKAIVGDIDTNYKGNSCGWTFEGYIDLDQIKWLCYTNGLPEKDSKGKQIKYLYGDYAEWLLHTLE